MGCYLPHPLSIREIRGPFTSVGLDLTGQQVETRVMAHNDEQDVKADPKSVRLLTREEAELEDRTYWHSKTPLERLAAAEQLRQIAYGYDPLTDRIQNTFEYFQLKGS